MKKNRMMRMASTLLVAVLLTTCTISGTFAKYVTSDTATDSARVAKFGVVVAASGSLFDETYIDAPTEPGTPGDPDLAVVSHGAVNGIKNVVAPGTNNAEGMKLAVTGTPEVDVNIAVDIVGYEDIFLGTKNGLPDMTTGETTDTFDNTAAYHPVKFTLVQTKAGADKILVDEGTIEAVISELGDLNNTKVDANTNLDTVIGTLKLTWAWDFDASGAGTYDKQDTLLGDLAAGIDLTPDLPDGTTYNTEIGIEFKVTVTQID